MKRALLVDDSKSARLIIKKLLEKQQLEVAAVESGEVAIDSVKESKPDMIFIDFQMPGLSGIETMQKIHQIPGYAGIPVVICTGNEEDGFLDTAQEAGAVSVLTKPPSPKGLRAALQQVADYEAARPAAPEPAPAPPEAPSPEPAPPEPAPPEAAPAPAAGLSEAAIAGLVEARLEPALGRLEQQFQERLDHLRSQLSEAIEQAGGNQQDTLNLIASSVGDSFDPLQRELSEGLTQVREEFNTQLAHTREEIQAAAAAQDTDETFKPRVEAALAPRLAALREELEGRLQALREDLDGLAARIPEAAAPDEARVRELAQEVLEPRIERVSAETDDIIDALRRDLDALQTAREAEEAAHQDAEPAPAPGLDEDSVRVLVSEDLDARAEALSSELEAKLDALRQELQVSREAEPAPAEGETPEPALDREQGTLLIQDLMEPRIWAVTQEFEDKLANLRTELAGEEKAEETAEETAAVDEARLQALREELEQKIEALRSELEETRVTPRAAPQQPSAENAASPVESVESVESADGAAIDALLDRRFEAQDKAWQTRMEALRLHLLSIIDRYREKAGLPPVPQAGAAAEGDAAAGADRTAIEAYIEDRLQALRMELGQLQPQIAEDEEPIELSELAEPAPETEVTAELSRLSSETAHLREDLDRRLAGLRAEVMQWVDQRLDQIKHLEEGQAGADASSAAAEEVAELSAETIELTGIAEPSGGEGASPQVGDTDQDDVVALAEAQVIDTELEGPADEPETELETEPAGFDQDTDPIQPEEGEADLEAEPAGFDQDTDAIQPEEGEADLEAELIGFDQDTDAIQPEEDEADLEAGLIGFDQDTDAIQREEGEADLEAEPARFDQDTDAIQPEEGEADLEAELIGFDQDTDAIQPEEGEADLEAEPARFDQDTDAIQPEEGEADLEAELIGLDEEETGLQPEEGETDLEAEWTGLDEEETAVQPANTTAAEDDEWTALEARDNGAETRSAVIEPEPTEPPAPQSPSEYGSDAAAGALREDLLAALDQRLESQASEVETRLQNLRLEVQERLEQSAPAAPAYATESGLAPEMEDALRNLATDFNHQIDTQRQELLSLVGELSSGADHADTEALDRAAVEAMINKALEGLAARGLTELELETVRAEILEISRNEANQSADKVKKLIIDAVVAKLKDQSQQLNKRLEKLLGDVKGYIVKQRTEIEKGARDAATRAAESALAHASEFPENNITGIEDDFAALRDEFNRKLMIFSGGAALVGVIAGLLFALLM